MTHIDKASNHIFNEIINKVDQDKHIQKINSHYITVEDNERLNQIDVANVKEIIYQKLKEKYSNYYIDIEKFTYKEYSKRDMHARETNNIGLASLFTLGILLPWEISRSRKIWKEITPIYRIDIEINFRKSMVIEEEWSSLKTRRNKN